MDKVEETKKSDAVSKMKKFIVLDIFLMIIAVGAIYYFTSTSTQRAALYTEMTSVFQKDKPKVVEISNPTVSEHPTGDFLEKDIASYQVNFDTNVTAAPEYKEIKAVMATPEDSVEPWASSASAQGGYAKVDLNHDGVNEVIAYPDAGGSHGFPLRVFKKEQAGWLSIFGDNLVTQGVYVLPSVTNGFSDLLTAYWPIGTAGVYQIWKWDGKSYSGGEAHNFKK